MYLDKSIRMEAETWKSLESLASMHKLSLNNYIARVLRIHVGWITKPPPPEPPEKKKRISKKMDELFGPDVLTHGFAPVPWVFLTTWNKEPLKLSPMEAMLIITVLHYEDWQASDKQISGAMGISVRYLRTLKASLRAKGVDIWSNRRFWPNADKLAARSEAVRELMVLLRTKYHLRGLFARCLTHHDMPDYINE